MKSTLAYLRNIAYLLCVQIPLSLAVLLVMAFTDPADWVD